MTDKRAEFADRLFDALGATDDRLITAAAGKATVRRKRGGARYILLAACITLFVCAIGAGMWSIATGVFTNSKKESSGETDIAVSKTLEVALNIAAESEKVVCLSADEIDLFDGKTSVIWRYGETEEYHVAVIEGEDGRRALSAALSSLEKGVVLISPSDAGTADCEVWISYGNGTVASPYLYGSAGNVGYGELFDYSPELEPSAKFAEVILKLIS